MKLSIITLLLVGCTGARTLRGPSVLKDNNAELAKAFDTTFTCLQVVSEDAAQCDAKADNGKMVRFYCLVACKNTASTASTASPSATITADNGVFMVAVGKSGYVINGKVQPTLTVTRGKTYRFDVDTTENHPFFIKTTKGVGAPTFKYNGGPALAVATGITHNGAHTGTILFTVPTAAPDTLYYNCENHAAMWGEIKVVN